MDAIILSDADKVVDSRGDTSHVFPFASVTKLFAAYSALIAIERHVMSLDDPAGPATVRHLLGHASGLPFDHGATREPGSRRIYSNKGIEVLGDKIEECTGSTIQEWIEETVLLPLGLSTILIEGSPAYSGEGSVEDLAAFGRELLTPTLVSPEFLAEATTPSFGELSGVLPGFGRQKNNAFGLGFEIRDHKDPHWLSDVFPPETFGHFGQAGSFLYVDPIHRMCGAYLGDMNFSEVHKVYWPQLTKSMFNGQILDADRDSFL